MNILDKSAIRECTSCQLCATMCAHDAIKIVLNDDGFYRPVVDGKKCTDCGLCTKICYKFDEDVKITTPEQLAKTQLYSAWSNDDDLVRNTTSGGIGDLLAHKLLSQGYKVVGCVYNDEKVRAEHRIATMEEELIPFRGSKYIQSYNFDAFKEVVKNCKKEKYAVFGTPCQIYALSKIAEMRKVRDQFVFVDFYCHGCPSLHVWTKYQDYIKETKKLDHFDRVDFRSKAAGWGAFYVVEVVVDGKPVFKSKKNLSGFYELFFCDQVLNDGCAECLLRGTLAYTDIRMGDFWGKKFLNNTRGVSGVSIVTDRGRKIFDIVMKNDVTATLCDYKDFLPYQSYGKFHHPRLAARKAILESLKDSNQDVWNAVCALHANQPLKVKLVRYAKNVLALFPLEVTNAIKKFV